VPGERHGLRRRLGARELRLEVPQPIAAPWGRSSGDRPLTLEAHTGAPPICQRYGTVAA
jgi:hypothetical protein